VKYNKARKLNDTDCSSKCGGDLNTNCGGESEISIYEALSQRYVEKQVEWITKLKDIDYIPMLAIFFQYFKKF